ncbi:hypothetical protein G6F31_015798 [Rhizopus arrhizus]|nr:hypothetical protein G6F31_015798 [Rhizopus arrhizus]
MAAASVHANVPRRCVNSVPICAWCRCSGGRVAATRPTVAAWTRSRSAMPAGPGSVRRTCGRCCRTALFSCARTMAPTTRWACWPMAICWGWTHGPGTSDTGARRARHSFVANDLPGAEAATTARAFWRV